MRSIAIALVLGGALAGCEGGDTDDTVDPDLPDLVQLWVNEFMASNQGSLVVGEDTPDWIEIYNPGAAAVDLADWNLSDDATEPDKHVISGELLVPAQGFLLLYADGSPELGVEHLPFKLSAAGEEIQIADPYGRPVDWVQYEAQAPDISTARVIDGDPESGWTTIIGGTPGASNEQ